MAAKTLADIINAPFQSYQSKQINPDSITMAFVETDLDLFQSYQSKQINPDNT